MKCTRCQREAIPGRKLCETCRQTLYTNRKTRMDEWKAAGLCQWCGKSAPLAGASWCRTCALKRICTMRFGSGKRWQELGDLLDAQNCQCVYTGIPLMLGVNASIDHIIPEGKGGDHSIQNLQWVETSINRMKFDMDDSEFRSHLRRVADALLAGASSLE